jgi:TonB family protein
MIMGITRRVAATCLVILLLGAVRLQAQDTLAAARELYASAQYDNALKLLDRLSVGTPSGDEQQSIDLYRSLCLLAVGRHEDAARSIESIIVRDPLYQPGEDLSPRMRTAFTDARKRMLPAIVQQQYADAKGAFERKEFDAAASGFKRVVDALNDPDMGRAASQPPLADLRTLAAGFYDLSVKAVLPPVPPPPQAQPAVAAAAAVAPPPPVKASQPPRIYTGEERNVVPPQTLIQALPKYPGAVPPRGVTGVVEVIVNETGTVESAAMVVPVTSSYDKQVLTAATKWLYVPAMMNGTPVKFRKRIQITVTPPAP